MSIEPDAFSKLEYDGWQRAAGKYESAWSSLTRQFIPHLLDAAQVGSGQRVLDVACGPGYVAEAAAARGAMAIGVDFADEMVRIARQRTPHIDFRQGDAQALDFPAHAFDVVVMNFGLLHLARPEAAFAEAHRVLRPGGRYAFTVWAQPEQNPGDRIVDEAVHAHADLSVPIPQGPDYFGFTAPRECGQALARAGFDRASMRFQTVRVEWQVPTASFLFEMERDAGVRTAAVLAAQTPATLAAIQAQIETGVRQYPRGDGFAIPFTAHVIAVSA